KANDRMPRHRRRAGAEARDDRVTLRRGIRAERKPLLDPELVGGVGARPRREDADARAERGDRVEVVEDRVPWGPLEYGLRDVIRRFDVELEGGDEPERPEVHDGAREVGVAPLEETVLTIG